MHTKIRTVKPSYHSSRTISSISVEAAYVGVALLSLCDDEGYFDADPQLVKASLFPRRNDIDVEKSIQELEQIEFVETAVCSNGYPYGFIPNFERDQIIRADRKRDSEIKGLCSWKPSLKAMTVNCQTPDGHLTDGNRNRKCKGNGNRNREVEKEKEKDAGNESVSFSSIESFDSEDRRGAFIGACVGIKPDEWSDQEKELFLKLNPSLDDCRLMKRFYDMKESEMQKGGTNYWLSKLSDLLTRWTMMKGRAIKRIEQCKASGGSGPAAIQQSTKAETAHQISLQVKQLEDLMLEHKERFFFNMQWDPPEKAAEYRSMKEKLEIHKRRLAGI